LYENAKTFALISKQQTRKSGDAQLESKSGDVFIYLRLQK